MAAAWEAIYRRHRQGMFTLALSITRCATAAEDAVHEAFSRLLDSRSQPAGDAVSYAFAAVRNAAVDQNRRQKGRDRPLEDDSIFRLLPQPDGVNPAAEAEAREQESLARRALEALDEQDRQAVVLRLYAGLTFQQIAAATHEPLPTVASRYRRALGKIRHQLAQTSE